MIIPTTLFGIAAVVALVVPGLVYAAIRTTLQGFVAADQSVTARIVQAVLISVLLDSLYLVLLGGWTFEFVPQSSVSIPHPRILGLIIFVLGVFIPGFIAYIRYGQAAWVMRAGEALNPLIARTLGWAIPQTGYRSVPTAWDWIAPKKSYKWVRVLNAQGRWVGGWATADTFVSSYPEPRELYIPEQWDLDPEGKFLQRSGATSGVWLSLEGAQVVEWLEPTDSSEEGDEND
jgi:hypothetical protein